MAVVLSLSTSFVPTCTKTDPSLPDAMIFCILSGVASILGPGKQTTTSSLLFKTLSIVLTIGPPQKYLRSLPHPLYCYLKIAFPLDPFRHILSCSLSPGRLLSISLSSINLPSFPHISWLTCAPVAFPPDTLPPVSLIPVSTIPSRLLPSRLLRSCLPHSFLIRSSCLPSCLFPSRLPTTCRLASSQPHPRLR